MKTKAAVLWEYGDDWKIEEVDLDPPKAGEVLVQMKAAGLCHSDEHVRVGDTKLSPEMVEQFGREFIPCIGGHEGAGVVVEVGENVKTVAPGDHVAASFIPSCGRCYSCVTGKQNLCDLGMYLFGPGMITDQTDRHTVNGQWVNTMCKLGTFSEHTVVSEDSLIKIDDDIPFPQAAIVSCGVATGWGSSVYRADVTAGDTVVVIGCGGVGSNAVQGARMAGASQIVAVDPVEFKREKAQEFGATHTAASMEEALPLVTEITNGVLAEKAIITVGVMKGEYILPAMELVTKGGTVVVTAQGDMLETDAQVPSFWLSMLNKEVKGTIFGSGNPRATTPKLLNLYRMGQLKLDELITNTYSLDQINEGYQDMRDGKNIRGVIVYE
jgi:S-(hydroxymethyl)glutathione dehydrogenase/alcohol dehydrogenase